MGCRFAKTTFLQLVEAAFLGEDEGELAYLKESLQNNEDFKTELIRQAESLEEGDPLKEQMLEFARA